MYIDSDSTTVIIGGSTLGAFAMFITALIINGLESLMELVIPFIICLLVLEPLIALIFIIITLCSYRNTTSDKIIKIIFIIICTAFAIVVTLIFKEIMAGCVYDNPGIFDIILFAITGYFFGAICAISLMGWFMALLASMDDISDMCYVSVVYEILPLVVLFIILRALS